MIMARGVMLSEAYFSLGLVPKDKHSRKSSIPCCCSFDVTSCKSPDYGIECLQVYNVHGLHHAIAYQSTYSVPVKLLSKDA